MGLKSANNAKGLIQGTLLASGTSVTLKDGKGGLFPSVYPYRVTLSKFVNSTVTQREIVEVTNKVGDTFTITRAVENCPSNDTDATSQTSTAFKFDDNDSFQLTRPVSKDEEIDGRLDGIDADKLDKSTYNAEKNLFTSTSTGTDAYQITDIYNTDYVDGKTYKIKADVANTGAATLQVNSLAVKDLKKMSGGFSDLITGDIVVNQIFWATYNLTQDVFQFSVDPASPVSVSDASETVKGIVELSDSTQALNGTDDLTAMTPKKTKDNYGFGLTVGSITATGIASTALQVSSSYQFTKQGHIHFQATQSNSFLNHTMQFQTSPDNSTWTTRYSVTQDGTINNDKYNFSMMIPAGTYIRTTVQTSNSAFFDMVATAYYQE